MNGERVVFRYKAIAGRFSPTATVGICLNETWYRLDAYVDSGAAYSIIHGDFARDVGFDFDSGQRILVKVGDGSLIPVYVHRVPLQIGPYRIDARSWARSQVRLSPTGCSCMIAKSCRLFGQDHACACA